MTTSLTYLADGPSLPVCAVCNRFVDKLTSYTDERRRERVIVAHCHGETETVTFGECELADGPVSLAPGVAFSKARAALPPRSLLLTSPVTSPSQEESP